MLKNWSHNFSPTRWWYCKHAILLCRMPGECRHNCSWCCSPWNKKYTKIFFFNSQGLHVSTVPWFTDLIDNDRHDYYYYHCSMNEQISHLSLSSFFFLFFFFSFLGTEAAVQNKEKVITELRHLLLLDKLANLIH